MKNTQTDKYIDGEREPGLQTYIRNATDAGNAPRKYPDCYLHVEECMSGETWIQPILGNALLDIKHQVKRWIRQEFGGELQLDGELIPRLQGDYYAKIMTDGRSPDSVVCWTSGGFYLKA